MMSTLYLVLFIITTGNFAYLAQKKYKHTDRYLWSLVIIIPVEIFGYWIKSTVHTPEASMVTLCFQYLCTITMMVICLFTAFQGVGININSNAKIAVASISLAHLLGICFSKDTALYYSSIKIVESNLGSATVSTSGPLKITHYIFLCGVIAAMLIALVYGIAARKNYAKMTVKTYVFFVFSGICVYLLELGTDFDFSLLPIVYALASFIATVRYDHYQSHELTYLIGERQSKSGHRGYASFDREGRLLGYSPLFRTLVPEISEVGIDEKIKTDSQGLISQIYPAIELYEKKEVSSQTIYEDGKIYSLTVSPFSVNSTHMVNGYLLILTDITVETERQELVDKYHENLNREVMEKTKHISDIQGTIVLGLANMIENRDDNTGGHVKRTSDIIKILVSEVIRRKTYDIDEIKAQDIIRAAPMHDLGKIAIDNSILCKPARLTDDEFYIMKTHAVKSSEIVKIILEGVEEQHFVDIAYNVARHHHERWDGKGYPDRMLGESIPVEARIMAVADVYDALVSKRCYKEPMSFEQAFRIMNECMGTQFDPAMRPVFVACRQELEKYYKNVNQNT